MEYLTILAIVISIGLIFGGAYVNMLLDNKYTYTNDKEEEDYGN
jgi:hypothetical protein